MTRTMHGPNSSPLVPALHAGISISVPREHVRTGGGQRVFGMPGQQRDRQYRLIDMPV